MLEPIAREQLHHDEPDRAVHQVLDEVGRAVALALEQRARGRRRVHHHRAAGQEAERRREEHPVLERLLPGSGHQSTIRQPLPDASRAISCRGAHGRRTRSRRGARQRPARSRRGAHERLEVVAALVERAVLVVGRARGREQDDVAGRRGVARGGDGALEVAAVVQRDARRRERTRPAAPASSPDEVGGARALGERGRERRVVLVLAATAEDRVHAARERADADDGGRDVRRLGVVDVEHAVDPPDLLEPVLDAARSPPAPPAPPRGRRRARA